jgi:putative ABC transport system ATP-binding protein
MALLQIEHVSKRHRRGRREHVALQDVSLSVEAGEVVAVLGSGNSGRRTLLRVAAGLELPDDGRVLFEGVEMGAGQSLTGHRVAFCHTSFNALEGDMVVDHVATGLLAKGFSPVRARRAAHEALARCGASGCADFDPSELDSIERVRVAFARALVGAPALMVVDEPTAGVGLLESDPLLRLLRSFAQEGMAVLLATSDASSLAGIDRVVMIADGMVRGETHPGQAEVLPFAPARRRGRELRA